MYGKMTLVLTLMIGAKYINFGAIVPNNFQCGGVQLIWRTIGQGPTGLAVGAGSDCLYFFFSPLRSSSLWETVRNLLKYWLKKPPNPKQQPTKYMNI